MRSWTGLLLLNTSGLHLRSLRVLLVLLGLWLGVCGETSAAEAPDLLRLRDVICHRIESSAEAIHPEWMRGDGDKSWGLCQIQYRTAVGIGGLKWLERAGGFPAVFIVLGDADKAKDVALTILRWCAGVKGRKTVIGLAACYNSPGLPYPKDGPLRNYAERTARIYKEGGR